MTVCTEPICIAMRLRSVRAAGVERRTPTMGGGEELWAVARAGGPQARGGATWCMGGARCTSAPAWRHGVAEHSRTANMS